MAITRSSGLIAAACTLWSDPHATGGPSGGHKLIPQSQPVVSTYLPWLGYATARMPHFAISESPAFVGRAVVALATDPEVARWNGKSLSSGQLAKVYGFTDLDGSRPDAWRYVAEVQDAGKPADVTGYR